jgi:S1-C subfamily serine protease
VGQAQQVEVVLHDKSQLPAKVIGTDPDTDLAIIKVDTKGRSLVALEYVGEGTLSVGQKVLAIGNPFGLGGSLSIGVISSLGRDIRATNDRTIKDVIQTDAAINPGNSGGPLLDTGGRLIGINTQIISQSGGSEGIGFAISAKTVKKIANQLIQFGRVLRPTLGISGIGLPTNLLAGMGIPAEQGVMLTETYRGSPADRAGLKIADRELILGFRRLPFGGDVVYQIDNQLVSTLGEIIDYISEKKQGDSVTVHYYRGKNKKSVKVKLALPPGVRRGSM